jgi:hypothetical protein
MTTQIASKITALSVALLMNCLIIAATAQSMHEAI